jgi:hypothetical protein
MITIEERVISLEQEVAGMKAILTNTISRKKDWEKSVGQFENDPLFQEAIQLGREFREAQPLVDADEGA